MSSKKEIMIPEEHFIKRLMKHSGWSRREAIEYIEKAVRRGELTPYDDETDKPISEDERRNYRLFSGLH